MKAYLLLRCALLIFDRGPESDECRYAPPAVYQAVEATRSASASFPTIPPAVILSAVFRESSFDIHARGAFGEIGLMQLKRGRGGPIPRDLAHASRRALEDPALNIYLGTRYMARIRLKCPDYFLSRYNRGPAAACRVTSYHRKISNARRAALALNERTHR